jgi:hypothetical protein
MQGFNSDIATLGAIRTLEYVPLAWVEEAGFPNRSLKWLNGIALKEGKTWLRADGTFINRSLSFDLQKAATGRRLYSRNVEIHVNRDTVATRIEWEDMKNHRFLVRAVLLTGETILLCTPQYPAEFSVSGSASMQSPVSHQRGLFSIQTPTPIYSWDFVPTYGFIDENSGINTAIQQGFIYHRKVASLLDFNTLAAQNNLVTPAIYYIADTEAIYYTPSASTFKLLGGNTNLQVLRQEFTIQSSNVFDVTNFTVSDADTNVFVYWGGILRNKGEGKDYKVLSNNRLEWQWLPDGGISGVIIKIII